MDACIAREAVVFNKARVILTCFIISQVAFRVAEALVVIELRTFGT